MHSFEFKALIQQQRASGKLYLEFLREASMSAGVYVLPAGADDPQTPHAEDEVYVVIGGRAHIQVGDQDRAVEHGSIIYVPAMVPHRFHSISEELAVLVIFAPPESGGN